MLPLETPLRVAEDAAVLDALSAGRLQLGFGAGFVAQHHFRAEYGRLPSPLVLLEAITQRTRRIELGTGLVTLPLEDPLRLAEDATVLDVLSNGRVPLRLGSGGANTDAFSAFGIDADTRQTRFAASLERLEQALSGTPLAPAASAAADARNTDDQDDDALAAASAAATAVRRSARAALALAFEPRGRAPGGCARQRPAARHGDARSARCAAAAGLGLSRRLARARRRGRPRAAPRGGARGVPRRRPTHRTGRARRRRAAPHPLAGRHGPPRRDRAGGDPAPAQHAPRPSRRSDREPARGSSAVAIRQPLPAGDSIRALLAGPVAAAAADAGRDHRAGAGLAPRLARRMSAGLLLDAPLRDEERRATPAEDWIAIATTATEAGCAVLLLSAGPGRPDPWIAAAVLSEALPELALTIALQAGAILPVAAALRAQSLQSLRGGRLALAVEPDALGAEASRRGAALNRDHRRARRLEFLAILHTFWAGAGPLDHQGA